jgi:hypothetical protein
MPKFESDQKEMKEKKSYKYMRLDLINDTPLE